MSLPAAFVSVILIWSTTPLAIQWSALGTSPSFAVLSRMALGVLLCAAVLALLRVPFPLHRHARRAYLVSGLSMFGAMSLTYWAAQSISSGMISVLFGLSPLLTSVGAAVWLKEEALTLSKIAGIGLGLLGLLLVFYGNLHLGSSAAIGLVALLLAVLAQSLGLVWLKRIGDDSPPLATTLGTLLVALPCFFAVWCWAEGAQLPAEISTRALLATGYLASFGSVLGFALYYYLIKHWDAGRIALITLITPVLALLLGHLLNNEAVLPQVWLGTASILLGLCVHRWGGQWAGNPTN
jgi:drug/metabolite transporter (DMT)-like permease